MNSALRLGEKDVIEGFVSHEGIFCRFSVEIPAEVAAAIGDTLRAAEQQVRAAYEEKRAQMQEAPKTEEADAPIVIE